MNEDARQASGGHRKCNQLVAPCAHPYDAPPAEPKPRLLQKSRRKIRMLRLAFATEKAYLGWIERYLRFHKERTGKWVHPWELGSEGANRFLSFLATHHA